MKNIKLLLKENEEKVLPLVWTKGSGEMTVNVKLVGRGAKLSLLGAFYLTNSDEVKVDVNIEHVAADTTSDTLIKSVLDQRAVGSFTGMVTIKKGAKNTTTFFREDALLLSDTAKAEAIPSLEIDENEVKAGHASTVGPVDGEQMFYLMSRGISGSEARRLIVKGYFTTVLAKFPSKEREAFENFVSKQIKMS